MTTNCDSLYARFDELHYLLRARNLSASADRWIAVNDLLTQLKSLDKQPSSHKELCNLLAPLFCAKQEDRETFEDIFYRWAEGDQQVLQHLTIINKNDDKADDNEDRFAFLKKAALFFGLFFAAMTLAVILLEQTLIKPVTEKIECENNSQIQNSECKQNSQQATNTEIDNPKPTDNSETETERKNGEPEIEERYVINDKYDDPVFQDLWLSQQSDSLQQSNNQKLELSPIYEVEIQAIKILYLLEPVVFLLCWRFISSRRVKLILKLKNNIRSGNLLYLEIKQGKSMPFSEGRFCVRMHKSQHSPSRKLHVDKTVEASINKAGIFNPVYQDRREVPEYVVLLDNPNNSDQLFALGETLISRLETEHLNVKHYFFRNDPRWCYERLSIEARALSLSKIHALHPGARLIVISQGSELFDPLNNKIRPWITCFNDWPVSLWLTNAPQPWGFRESQLAENGFVLAPLNSDGLDVIAQWLANSELQTFIAKRGSKARGAWAGGFANDAFPKEFEIQDWNSDFLIPPPEITKKLIRSLQNYLGQSGFLLLCACAAYPKTHGNLSIALEQKLFPEASIQERESRLLKLSALPWFSNGVIPQYLREKFLAQLSTEQYKDISGIYNELFKLSLDSKNSLALYLPGSNKEQEEENELAESHDTLLIDILRGRKSRADQLLPSSLTKIFKNAYQPNKNSLRTKMQVSLCLSVCLALWLFWPKIDELIRPLQIDRMLKANSETISIFYGHSDHVTSAHFGPSRDWVFSTSYGDGHIWDVKTIKVLASLDDHQGSIMASDISRDGSRAVTATNKGFIYLWDITNPNSGLTTRTPIAQFNIDNEDFREVKIGGTNNNYILAKSRNRNIYLWNIDTQKPALTFNFDQSKTPLEVDLSSSENRLLSLNQNELLMLDLDKQTSKKIAKDDLKKTSFFPDGKQYFTVSKEREISFYNKEQEDIPWSTFNIPWLSYNIAIDSFKRNKLAIYGDYNNIRILSFTQGQEINRLSSNQHQSHLTLNDEASLIAVSDWDNDITLIDINTGLAHARISGRYSRNAGFSFGNNNILLHYGEKTRAIQLSQASEVPQIIIEDRELAVAAQNIRLAQSLQEDQKSFQRRVDRARVQQNEAEVSSIKSQATRKEMLEKAERLKRELLKRPDNTAKIEELLKQAQVEERKARSEQELAKNAAKQTVIQAQKSQELQNQINEARKRAAKALRFLDTNVRGYEFQPMEQSIQAETNTELNQSGGLSNSLRKITDAMENINQSSEQTVEQVYRANRKTDQNIAPSEFEQMQQTETDVQEVGINEAQYEVQTIAQEEEPLEEVLDEAPVQEVEATAY